MQPQAAKYRPLFYPLAGLLVTLAVIAGFWPQYYQPLITGRELAPRNNSWGIHLHSALFLAWVAGFALQALFVRLGQVRLHRRIGTIMAALGLATVVVGTWAAFAANLEHVRNGLPLDRGATILFFIVSDMGMFAGFLAAGIAYRDRREIHKRLMLLATLSLAFVGMGRLIAHVSPTLFPQHRWAAILIMLTPVFAAIGHDLYRRRAIHPVYVIGLGLFLLRLLRVPFAMSETWLAVGRSLLRPFL